MTERLSLVCLMNASFHMDFPGGSVVKNLTGNAGNTGHSGLISARERFLGGENGNPLQYSCLENAVDRGAWGAAVHRVAGPDMTEHLCTQAIFTCRNYMKTSKKQPL